MPPRTPDTIDFANDPELAALFAGDDPLRQNVQQAPGGDALDLGAELTPPLSDLELLDLQLQTAAPPGSLGPVRPRPLPPDDLAGELVEPQGPPPAPPAPLGLADNWDEVRGQLWAAIAEGGGKASRKSGEPWVKGIRLGPAG